MPQGPSRGGSLFRPFEARWVSKNRLRESASIPARLSAIARALATNAAFGAFSPCTWT